MPTPPTRRNSPRADAAIDWSRPAIDIERQVRALAGRQSACAYLGEGCAPVRVNILAAKAMPDRAPPGELVKCGRDFRVGCGTGALLLETVQLARGKGRPMAAADAANGYPGLFKPGARFHGRV